jgi:hypothetical protein
MQAISRVFIVKIGFTVFAWCIPLLLFPSSLLQQLGFPLPTPTIFLRLLGMAYAALLVGYVFGLRSALQGNYPAGAVWAGIVSNGGAFLLLCGAATQGTWAAWGVVARMVMWGSLLSTGAITLGLVVYGPGRSHAAVPRYPDGET